MDVTLPNGVVIRGVPEGTTKDQIMQKAIASGMAKPEDFGVAEPQQAQQPQRSAPEDRRGTFANEGMYEGAGGLRGGFMRGVEQTLGGMGQRLLEINKRAADEKVQTILDGMRSGEIPTNEQTIAELQAAQDEAVKFTQGLAGAEKSEKSSRDQYAPIAEENPITSTVGNIAGQMAALPVPAMRLKLPGQIIKGAGEGAVSGYVQATTEDERPVDAALLGGGIGGAAPVALRPLTNVIGGAYRAAVGKPKDDIAKVVDYATEKDLPLMTTDVVQPDTFVGRSAQALGEKIPVAGTGAARAEQQAARIAEVRRMAEQYGDPSDDEIVQSLRAKSTRIQKAAGDRYQQVATQMAYTEIPLNETLRTIDEQMKRYGQPGSIQNPRMMKTLQEVRDQLSASPQNLELLRQNRTLFRETLRGDAVVGRDSEQRVIDSVYKAMTNDMTRGVSGKLGTETAASMRQADAIWAREANEVKKTKLKNILNKGDVKPEEASKMLFSNDVSEIKTLFSALDTNGRNNARAAIVQRAFDKSDGSPDKFYNEMRRLKNQAGVFFRGEQGKEMNGLINYLNHTKEAGQAGVRTKTGQELLQYGGPAAVMTDVATTGGVGTATFAGFGALARMYESPQVRNIMVRMSSIEPGSTEFEKLAAQLNSLLETAATRAANTQQEEQ